MPRASPVELHVRSYIASNVRTPRGKPVASPSRGVNVSGSCERENSTGQARGIFPLPRGESLVAEGLEAFVADAIALPVFVIEVPPLGFVDGEALRFHCRAKEIAVPALE